MAATPKKVVSKWKNDFRLTPVFSKDGAFFYVVRGDALCKFSAVNGDFVAKSEPHKNKILAFSFSGNRGAGHLISIESCGKLNFFCAEMLKLVATSAEGSNYAAAISVPSAEPGCASFVAAGVKADNSSCQKKRRLGVYKIDVDAVSSRSELTITREKLFTAPAATSSPLKLAVSARAKMVLVFGGKYTLLWSAARRLLRRLPSTSRITAACFSAEGGVLATGDGNGVIRLWHIAEAKDKGPVPSTLLHWHAAEVACVSFAEMDRVLLSGAGEGVLVSWQVETGRKDFLPRLGAPLRAISATSAACAVLMADNSLAVIDSQFSGVVCRVRGLSLDKGTRFIFFDGRNHRLFCDGANGAIQFSDLINKNAALWGVYHVVQNNVIACSNSTGVVDAAAGGSMVVLAAFCDPWVVTIDKKRFCHLYADDSKVAGQQMTLRFHLLSDGDDPPIAEKAAFPSPHSDAITAVTASGERCGGAVFTISEAEIRRWRFRPSSSALEPEWRCDLAVGRPCHLNGLGDGVAVSAAICRDGSVLAILDIKGLDLYKADNLKLVNRLNFESQSTPMRGVVFWQKDRLILWGDRMIHSVSLKAQSEISVELGAGDAISGLSVISKPGGEVVVVLVHSEGGDDGKLNLYDTSLELEDTTPAPQPLLSPIFRNCTAAVTEKGLTVYYVTEKLELGSVVCE